MQFITNYTLLSTYILLYSILLRSTAVKSTTSPNSKTLDDFIKKSCQVTLYSDLCYSSLSSSYTSDTDLGMLTHAAIHISLNKAVQTAKYVAAVGNETTTGDDMAVQDCVELTKEAVEQVQRSLDQMSKVLRSKIKRTFEMSNVQTWMSAAITDLNTCIDGFSDGEAGKKDEKDELKSQVSTKVALVVKFTSNALALANSYVDATRYREIRKCAKNCV